MFFTTPVIKQILDTQVINGKTIFNPTDGATINCDIQPLVKLTEREVYGVADKLAYKVYSDTTADINKNDLLKIDNKLFKVIAEPERWDYHIKCIVSIHHG